MLKVQLKKYVGAVQMLKREGQTAEGEGETELGGEGARLLHLYHVCAWHIGDILCDEYILCDEH